MNDYQPINCEFHDVLEALATTRKPTAVEYLGADGVARRRDAVVRDVFGREGAEYLALSTGEVLRLDRIVSVDGVRLDGF